MLQIIIFFFHSQLWVNIFKTPIPWFITDERIHVNESNLPTPSVIYLFQIRDACDKTISSHTLPFKSLGLERFFLEEINAFIQQGRIKLIKSDSKVIYNVSKVCTSDKCCSSELSIQQRILNK